MSITAGGGRLPSETSLSLEHALASLLEERILKLEKFRGSYLLPQPPPSSPPTPTSFSSPFSHQNPPSCELLSRVSSFHILSPHRCRLFPSLTSGCFSIHFLLTRSSREASMDVDKNGSGSKEEIEHADIASTPSIQSEDVVSTVKNPLHGISKEQLMRDVDL